MISKQYQEKVLTSLNDYLSALSDAKKEFEELLKLKPHLAKHFDFPKEAWEQTGIGKQYFPQVNGLEEPLPDIYLKIPTGGGKTFLACRAVDLIQKTYLKRQTGLVIWIVPSSQIYRQTISALKNREHWYRQTLDISTGGKIQIREKNEIFTRRDIEENLVVFMLMLPSANRQNKETLKIFRDQGGFTDFFPGEDETEKQRQLKMLVPNLDCFSTEDEIFHTQIKTSLGNTLRLLRPLVIVDEGHKAYSKNARTTIRNLNPSFILELSATPPKDCNKLVEITGRELNNEEMIKLDIHLTNKTGTGWQNTLLVSYEKRNFLEQKAIEYEQNSGKYIRPICLIQVERTGKDQRGRNYIHAEDAKEYLIKRCQVPENQIAIKSSEKDDIEGIDLFAKDCSIRYIITKQALQEGWDCSFAYVLTILADPKSANGITQLIGRILRQPFAIKTQISELDECYVYTFRQEAAKLVRDIRKGLEEEGLGDLQGHIVQNETAKETKNFKDRDLYYRQEFKKFEGKIYLPKFVVQEKDSWRDIIFDTDILSKIDWTKINFSEIENLFLNNSQTNEQEILLGLSKRDEELLMETGRKETSGQHEIDYCFLARQIGEIIPNPWHCYDIGKKATDLLLKKYGQETVAIHFIFIIEELKKILEKERNRLSEQIFRQMVVDKRLCFFLISGQGGFVLPRRIKVKSAKSLVRKDNLPIRKSLFDYVPDENVNDLEKSVAIYLDEQENLLWWYRNMSRQDYHIQGWKRHKIYPDFIATRIRKTSEQYETVYVLETKGIYLKNEDTEYKQNIFKLCNELGTQKIWKELSDEFSDHQFEFQIIFEDEWQNKINQLFQ
jgi:type III restriction enzyme